MNPIKYSACVKEDKPVELTLNDCLACSGCISPDEIQSDYERFKNNTEETILLMNPYSSLHLSNHKHAIDTSNFQMNILNSVANDVLNNKVVITSDCPGTVAYIERTGNHLISYLSKVPSQQQLAVKYVKERYGMKVTSIVPCYDKKLENGRDKIDIDYVLTTEEFKKLSNGAKFNDQENINLSTPKYLYGSLSGGYTEHILSKLDGYTQTKLNDKYFIYKSGELILHKIYGKTNVLNFINKTKKGIDFNFAEVFLCEKGCAGGPLNLEFEIQKDMQPTSDYIEVEGFEREFKSIKMKKAKYIIEW